MSKQLNEGLNQGLLVVGSLLLLEFFGAPGGDYTSSDIASQMAGQVPVGVMKIQFRIQLNPIIGRQACDHTLQVIFLFKVSGSWTHSSWQWILPMCAMLCLQVTLDLPANQPYFIRDMDEGAGLDVEASMQHGSDGCCGVTFVAYCHWHHVYSRDAFIWDAPMSVSGHFRDAVKYVMKKFCSVRQQTASSNKYFLVEKVRRLLHHCYQKSYFRVLTQKHIMSQI